MKVHFIGAGPGAADLITLRGARLLNAAKMVIFAGALVSRELLQHCRAGAEIVDASELDPEEQQDIYLRARDNDWDVARLHSGDPAIYGATAAQMRLLDDLGIGYEVVPGVSSFTASAALLNADLIREGVSQTIILTRSSGDASPIPELESLDKLAAHRATLCIFLSEPHLEKLTADLLRHYPASTPVALIQKATWPEEKIWRGTLGAIAKEQNPRDWQLATMMLVGEALDL
jgi:precorrin-4/cobalt-precorrin-4 C11-methyltransferase